jgi:hypothetical protein
MKFILVWNYETMKNGLMLSPFPWLLGYRIE